MAQLTVEQALEQAVQHHQAGRLNDAETIYRQILAHHPDHVDAMHLLGVLAHQVGRNDIAINLIQCALSIRPDWPEALSNLGNALKARGQLDQAVVAYQSALNLRPDFAEGHNNLGNALKEQVKLDEAIAAFRLALTVRPGYPQALNNLGNVLRLTGQLDEAIDGYRQAIALEPEYPDAHNNLGIALQNKGKLDEALAAFHRAIALQPNHAEAHSNLGNALKTKGELDLAIAAYRQAIAFRPTYAQAYGNLGEALRNKGQLDAALNACRQAIALNSNLPEGYNNLGNVLRNQGKYYESIAAYRQAILLKPSYAQAYSNLGNVLRDYGELDEAVLAFGQAIALKPDYAIAHSGLGNALKDSRNLDAALVEYREAVRLDPADAEIHSNLVFSLNYVPGIDPQEAAEELRRWDDRHALPLGKSIQPHNNDRDPDRRLRVGYVSPDFRGHVVGRNLMPLFSNHDHRQFEIFGYTQVPSADGMTREFQQLSDSWCNIVGLSDEQVVAQIREDRIDILVDLTLHTGGNRLLVFARKPAPVQVTFMGYPGSTGLTAIDYRLSDPYLDPVGNDESIYSERTIRLPDSFWCYDPLDFRSLPVNPLPALCSGAVTFGCLNNFCKINGEVLSLWAKVLLQVKNSRLLLLAAAGNPRADVLKCLGKEGIDPHRVEFVTQQSRQKYLETYNRIDVGLDTFPYNGHTTSLDSFWMGVPVVTIVGKTIVGRAGWSQLSNLGLTELAANDSQQFVKIAVDLANDLPRLTQLRSTLRSRMEQSPLMNATGFARNIEAAYRSMWHNWCEDSG